MAAIGAFMPLPILLNVREKFAKTVLWMFKHLVYNFRQQYHHAGARYLHVDEHYLHPLQGPHHLSSI